MELQPLSPIAWPTAVPAVAPAAVPASCPGERGAADTTPTPPAIPIDSTTRHYRGPDPHSAVVDSPTVPMYASHYSHLPVPGHRHGQAIRKIKRPRGRAHFKCMMCFGTFGCHERMYGWGLGLPAILQSIVAKQISKGNQAIGTFCSVERLHVDNDKGELDASSGEKK